MERRGFLKYGSFALGTLGMIACGKNEPSNRRAAVGSGEKAPGADDAVKDSATKLANDSVIYTKENPGPWAGKEAKHLPALTAEGGKITIETSHVMEAEHYISRHQIRDEKDKILADRVLTAETAKPLSTFFIDKPAGKELRAYSTCNQHGIWMTAYAVADMAAGFIPAPTYSSDNPGQWGGKEASHIPTLTKGPTFGASADLGLFELDMANAHPMDEAHYICRHQIRDDAGLVIAENRLAPGVDTEAKSTFAIILPPGGSVHAFSTCNMHGTWKASFPVSEFIDIWSQTKLAPSGASATTHVPAVTRIANASVLGAYTIQIANTHVMTQDVHYISKHEVRDGAGLFMFEQRFQNPLPVAAKTVVPSSFFNIASGPFQVLALCNQHGYWEQLTTYDGLHAVYTDTAGPAGGAPDTHRPKVTVSPTTIKVSTSHVMEAAHFIACHQIRDATGKLLGLKLFNVATNTSPDSTFLRSPEMTGALKAYSFCNQHGIWKTEFDA